MPKAVIFRYMLPDLLSGNDMLAFFSFDGDILRARRQSQGSWHNEILCLTRIQKGDKYTVGNWLEYDD